MRDDLERNMNNQEQKRAERNSPVHRLGNNSRSRNHDNAVGCGNSDTDRSR
ncbi:MAG TPA: hypothetical protein VH480_15975 [Streptosporangiaceae bacterium]